MSQNSLLFLIHLRIWSRLSHEYEKLEEYKISDFINPLSHNEIKPIAIDFPDYIIYPDHCFAPNGTGTLVTYREFAESQFDAMRKGAEYYDKFFIKSGLADKIKVSKFQLFVECCLQ